MAAYVCVELESINLLPEIINSLLQRSVKLTVSKNPVSLCERCAKGNSTSSPDSALGHTTPLISISSQSSASIECTEEYPRSESIDSEPNENAKNEQSSVNLSFYQKNSKTLLPASGLISIKEKGPGSAPKQCQLCEHWITAKNARAHVATHLTIRRLRCTVCGKGFDRMNRASVHLHKCHPNDPTAKVESAMNAEQRREIDMLAWKCFPRRTRADPDEMN